jgi:hypothetical protein
MPSCKVRKDSDALSAAPVSNRGEFSKNGPLRSNEEGVFKAGASDPDGKDRVAQKVPAVQINVNHTPTLKRISFLYLLLRGLYVKSFIKSNARSARDFRK